MPQICATRGGKPDYRLVPGLGPDVELRLEPAGDGTGISVDVELPEAEATEMTDDVQVANRRLDQGNEALIGMARMGADAFGCTGDLRIDPASPSGRPSFTPRPSRRRSATPRRSPTPPTPTTTQRSSASTTRSPSTSTQRRCSDRRRRHERLDPGQPSRGRDAWARLIEPLARLPSPGRRGPARRPDRQFGVDLRRPGRRPFRT